jgi:hypothetical protein
MLDYETVGKTNPSETFDRMFSGLEILTQEFFENKKNGDKFRYCVVKIPDPMKESTIGDIFSDFEGAELGTVNGREWMTRGEPSYDGETFRIFGATRTAEYLYAIIYDTSDIKSSSRIARFLREITITDE